MSVSAFYPAVELAAMLIAVWSIIVMPLWLLLPTVLLGWSLLALSVIDWEHLLLPNALTLPLIAAGWLVSAVTVRNAPVDAFIGAVAAGVFFTAVSVLYQRLRQRDGLGLGDAKLFAAAGAWLGWQGLPSVLLIGTATALAATVGCLAIQGRRGEAPRRTEIPFGSYLALATWLTWLYGPLTVG